MGTFFAHHDDATSWHHDHAAGAVLGPGRPAMEMLETRLLLSGTAYLVDSLADTVAADGVVTLREAIEAANTNAAVFDAPAGSATDTDTITFDVAALQAEAGAGEPLVITLGGTELAISDDLDITGPGADVLTIDAGAQSRVISISGSGTDVGLAGLTVTGGSTTEDAGGIHNDGGTVTLTHMTVSGNSSTAGGSGIYNKRGTVTLTSSVVSGNSTVSQNCGL